MAGTVTYPLGRVLLNCDLGHGPARLSFTEARRCWRCDRAGKFLLGTYDGQGQDLPFCRLHVEAELLIWCAEQDAGQAKWFYDAAMELIGKR